MPELSQFERQLLEDVGRMEMVCLFEAAQPGRLASVASLSSAAAEPTEERCVHVGRVAAITLGRLSVDVEETCAIVEAFSKGQYQGLSVLALRINSTQASELVAHASQFMQMLSFEATGVGTVALDEKSRTVLDGAMPPPFRVRLVTCAFAAAFGSFIKLRGWSAADATQLVRTTFDGVRAGEAAHEKGT